MPPFDIVAKIPASLLNSLILIFILQIWDNVKSDKVQLSYSSFFLSFSLSGNYT